jgi:hypothetical protein
MTWAEAAGGTQACTISTEHTLSGAALTAAGTYVLVLDLNPMADGDVLEVRIKTIVRAAGTERVAYLRTYVNAQDADGQIKYSVPVPVNVSIKATLKQTAGTGRTFTYALVTV